ncbi:MAG: methyl-accepting chemotaxis protein [Gammaproteobacteria bacterium]|nr:methyl-accepting chemotaxis protein [Gammaproteobacteria bacterium]
MLLKNMKIRSKMMLILGSLIGSMVLVAVVAITNMRSIEKEIAGIAELDMPLITKLTKITEHQLEQGILFERIVRYGEQKNSNRHYEELLVETDREFEQAGKIVVEEIRGMEKLIEHDLELVHNEEQKKEFEKLLAMLKTLDNHIVEYERHTAEVFHAFESNQIGRGIELAERVEKEEEKVLNLVEQLLSEVEKFTKEAAVTAETDSQTALTLIMGIAISALVFGVIFGLTVSNSITKPVGHMLHAADELSQGDGDLTRRLPDFGRDEIGQTAVAFNGFIEKIHRVMVDVSASVENVASASEQVSSTAQTLSQGSSEQAASVEETSASLEEMSASINQNAENSRTTDDMANKASVEAKEGGEAVQETVKAMKEIADKIAVIEDIAYKTNLLALNAAIEAARAGEHGKGFAVVADEVRKLAERSQLSAQEISDLAGNSVDIAERAGQLLERMLPSILKTADLVQEITAASAEQSSGVSQVNGAMGQLDKVAQTNAAASEELAATAEELSAQAEHLQATVGFFKLGDGRAVKAQPAMAASRPGSTKAHTPVASAHQASSATPPKPSSGSLGPRVGSSGSTRVVHKGQVNEADFEEFTDDD